LFLKTLGRFDVAPVYDLEKGSFLKKLNGNLNGDDGRFFYKGAQHISVRQTNLIPYNHITLKWDGA
jgi:hypothetical protein